MTIKEIQKGYLTNPYFRSIYFYLAQNKLHSSKAATVPVELQAKQYLLLGSLLLGIH